jgi:hypothetical protein
MHARHHRRLNSLASSASRAPCGASQLRRSGRSGKRSAPPSSASGSVARPSSLGASWTSSLLRAASSWRWTARTTAARHSAGLTRAATVALSAPAIACCVAGGAGAQPALAGHPARRRRIVGFRLRRSRSKQRFTPASASTASARSSSARPPRARHHSDSQSAMPSQSGAPPSSPPRSPPP